jgi:hypothetical protein
MVMPARPFSPGGADRAVTRATTMPVLRRASRESRNTFCSATMPRSSLSRSMCCAPIEAPFVGGICQRLCGPPGPLNVPRLSMPQMPEYARRSGVPYGLL